MPADGAIDELGQRPGRDDLAVIDDDRARAARLGFLEMVRRQQQRHAGRAQVGEHVVDAIAALRIDADRRLVEQHDARPVHDAAGDVEAAAHAAGELLDRLGRRDRRGPVRSSTQSTCCASARARQPLQPAERLEVLARGEERIERHFLRHDAQLRAASARRAARSNSRISPPSRRTRPVIARISVVLPAPFGPSSASSSPSASSNDAPSSALTLPNVFVAFETVRTDMSAPGNDVRRTVFTRYASG